MSERDQNGRFANGNQAAAKENGGNGGRRPREVERRYLELLRQHVTEADFAEIVKCAVKDARLGDTQARKILFDYLLGVPVQRVAPTDPTGEYEYTGLGDAAIVGELAALFNAARARAAREADPGGEAPLGTTCSPVTDTTTR